VETQAELGACWSRAADEARARAAATYARAAQWLEGRQQHTARQRLADAQRQWDLYRKAYCDAVAGVYEGGSVAGTQRAHCEATLDARHADELATLISDASP